MIKMNERATNTFVHHLFISLVNDQATNMREINDGCKFINTLHSDLDKQPTLEACVRRP